jgi:hypothetical protein
MGDDARITNVKNVEELKDLPKGLSLFDPILAHEAKEELEAGGDVFVSRDARGRVDGLLIYDGFEETGTIFTKSREVFERLYRLKASGYIFAELEVPEHPRETWNIWQLDVSATSSEHSFRHHVSIDQDAAEVERFMAVSQPETNPKWVRVALTNGDKCFVVRIMGRVVAVAWMSIVGGVARSHGLYVEPHFRQRGMMEDNFYARLLYLKSRRVHTLINEIAETNLAASKLAEKEGEKIVGKIFLYRTTGSAP